MGTLLKYFILFFCTFLFFFFFFTFPTSSSSSSPPYDQTHSSSSTATAQSQVFYVKHTTPFLIDRQRRRLTKNYRKRSRAGNKNKNPTKKFKNNGPFSVMLPKGFVPPSGSSPCHNGNPNDVVFFCDLAKP